MGILGSGQEAYVQVAPDSTGKKIRNLQITVVGKDATTGQETYATVEMQVVAIADSSGNILDVDDKLEALHGELEQIRELLGVIAEKLE